MRRLALLSAAVCRVLRAGPRGCDNASRAWRARRDAHPGRSRRGRSYRITKQPRRRARSHC